MFFIPLPLAIFAKNSKGGKIAKTNLLTGITSCDALGGESRVRTLGSNQKLAISLNLLGKNAKTRWG